MTQTDHPASTEPTSGRETAPNVRLPRPGQRRFPVGIVLIVAWVAVFLAIFIVLASLKIRGAPVQPQTPPGVEQSPGEPAPITPPAAPVEN
jgi:hypothetical protein